MPWHLCSKLQHSQSGHSQGIITWGRCGFHPQALAVILFSSLKKPVVFLSFKNCNLPRQFPVLIQEEFKPVAKLLFSAVFCDVHECGGNTPKTTGTSNGGGGYEGHLVKMRVQCFAKASISLIVPVELMQPYVQISSWGMTLKLVFLGEYQSLAGCSNFWLSHSRQCWKGWCKIISSGLM